MKLSIATVLSICLLLTACNQTATTDKMSMPAQFTISKTQLMDKIKGGWAGQTIGCTYGGPTEWK